MKRILLLLLYMAFFATTYSGRCFPYTGNLTFFPNPDSDSVFNRIDRITVTLPEEFRGDLRLTADRNGKPLYEAALILHSESESTSYTLRPTILSHIACRFELPTHLPDGNYELHIPEGYFEIEPHYIEVENIDIPEEQLINLEVIGAWHKRGMEWKHPGMFSYHDDDGMDGMIPSSSPGEYTHGYFSILYPMLESLGIRGCLSLEGRRAGFTALPPKLNDNAKIAKRLQDERGWEIMSHSMKCLGERLNNWVVDSIDSPLAVQILSKAENHGENSANTTSVYSRSDGKQYFPNSNNSVWTETTDPNLIRPFAGDYETGKPILYNEDYNVDYHWKEWFRIAEDFGIKGETWVMHNAQSCHKNVPAITAVLPHGFIDQFPFTYNTPPMMTAACRLLCEGQFFPNMNPTDNSYNYGHYEWLRRHIEETHKKGGWIVLGGHAYRQCWDNYIKGALVSEGGTYPDEWVNPLEGIDPLVDSLDPPSGLGIGSWSEWYPCPGTRLRMIWDLLKYAKSLGMINVTSTEGFEIMGNKCSAGYFTQGGKTGYDLDEFEGARNLQPHYVKGANDEEYYYNRGTNRELSLQFTISTEGHSPISTTDRIRAYTIDGRPYDVADLSLLPRGLWIVNRRKILVR